MLCKYWIEKMKNTMFSGDEKISNKKLYSIFCTPGQSYHGLIDNTTMITNTGENINMRELCSVINLQDWKTFCYPHNDLNPVKTVADRRILYPIPPCHIYQSLMSRMSTLCLLYCWTHPQIMKFSLERLLTNIYPRPEHLVSVRGVCDTVDIAGVTSELFQRFPALQSVYSDRHVETGRQQLKVFHMMNKKL